MSYVKFHYLIIIIVNKVYDYEIKLKQFEKFDEKS
jgi:hypothetical protein